MRKSPEESWMGLHPRVAGCACHVCHPESDYPAHDRSAIDAVLQHGWQVLIVGTGECECSADGECGEGDGPAFVSTMGLGHRAGHPEFVMSGLDPDLMHRSVNRLAQRVLDGRRFSAGDVVEDVLGGVPVVLERASARGLDETTGWSGWFHRQEPEALVVVWPTTSGVFAWQPGAPELLDERQPVGWREPTVHAGALAADPPWPFPVPPDAKAVTCRHVLEDRHAVLWVARQGSSERIQDWSIHCGADAHTDDEVAVAHIAHLVRGAPSLRELAALPLDWEAERTDVDSEWRTFPIG